MDIHGKSWEYGNLLIRADAFVCTNWPAVIIQQTEGTQRLACCDFLLPFVTAHMVSNLTPCAHDGSGPCRKSVLEISVNLHAYCKHNKGFCWVCRLRLWNTLPITRQNCNASQCHAGKYWRWRCPSETCPGQCRMVERSIASSFCFGTSSLSVNGIVAQDQRNWKEVKRT